MLSRLPEKVVGVLIGAYYHSNNMVLDSETTTMQLSCGEPELFLGWSGPWLMKIPIFILSLINPWVYAYHNVDFKRCMNRYVRKILVGWKFIGQEAKSNAGIFATVKLDRSYITTAQMANSNGGKAVFCSLHYLSTAVIQSQPNINMNVGNINGVCTCTRKQSNTLSPPPSPSPSSGYMKNIAFHMSASQRLDNVQSSLSR